MTDSDAAVERLRAMVADTEKTERVHGFSVASRTVYVHDVRRILDAMADAQKETRMRRSESADFEAERDAAEQARASAEAKLARIAETLSDAPECDVHPDDDPITCGWKRDMEAVRRILNEGTETHA